MIHAKPAEGRLLLTPLVAFLLLMLGLPTLLDLLYSVSDVGFKTLRAPRPEGLGNYAEVLGDPAFWEALSFSLRFGALTAAVEVGLALALAVYLSPILRAHPWALAVLTIPIMVAPAMMGLMYRLVLHEFVGPLPHYLLAWFGSSPAFLAPGTVFWTVAAVEVLQWTPFALLLLHLAYEAIPGDVREAALMDGAPPWSLFRLIELPLMMPALLVALTIRFIDGIRVFDSVFVLVGAGAGGATTSLPIYIYTSFFRGGEIGRALAASVILAVASLGLLVLLWGLARRSPA